MPFVHCLKPKVNFDTLNFTCPTLACACSACLRGQRMQRFRGCLQLVTCLGVQHVWLCKCNITSFMQLYVCSLKCSTGSLHRAKICPTRPTLGIHDTGACNQASLSAAPRSISDEPCGNMSHPAHPGHSCAGTAAATMPPCMLSHVAIYIVAWLPSSPLTVCSKQGPLRRPQLPAGHPGRLLSLCVQRPRPQRGFEVFV